MTDINELAQSLKAAAEKATQGTGEHSNTTTVAVVLAEAITLKLWCVSTSAKNARMMLCSSPWLTLPTFSRW